MDKIEKMCIVILSMLLSIIIATLITAVVKNEKTTKQNKELIEYQGKCIDFLEDSLKETINYYEDSLFVVNAKMDSIMERYLLYQYKIERVKYYTDIVDRDNSQMVFYKGWIKRAIK